MGCHALLQGVFSTQGFQKKIPFPSWWKEEGNKGICFLFCTCVRKKSCLISLCSSRNMLISGDVPLLRMMEKMLELKTKDDAEDS